MYIITTTVIKVVITMTANTYINHMDVNTEKSYSQIYMVSEFPSSFM